MPIGVLRKMLKEVQASARDEKPLAVGGARELAAALRAELGRGAAAGAVRDGDEPEGAAAVVHVLGGRAERGGRAGAEARAPGPRADRRVAAGPDGRGRPIPYVLATNVVRVRAGEGFSLEAIAAGDRRYGSARRVRRSRRGCRSCAARSSIG